MAQDPVDLYAQIYRRTQRQQDTQQRGFEVGSPLERAMAEERDNQIRLGIIAAPSPDAVARTTRVARQAGEAPALVEPSIDDIEKAQRADRFGKVAGQYPAVGQWAARNPRGAVAASDDHKALGMIGSAWESLKGFGQDTLNFLKLTPDIAQSFGRGTVVLASEANAALADIAEAANYPIKGALATIGNATGLFNYNPDEGWKRSQAYWQAGVTTAQKKYDANRPKYGGYVSEQVGTGLENLPSSVAAVIAGVASGSPAVTLSLMGLTTGLPAYNDARRAGKSVPTSLTYGIEQGAIEAMTEKIPASDLLQAIASKTPFGKTVMRQLAEELPNEQIATVLQDFSEWVNLHPDQPFSAYVAARPEAALSTALQTVAGTTAQTAATMAISRAGDVAMRVLPQAQKANEAMQDKAFIDTIERAATESKLRTRDPDEYAALMAHLGDVSGVSSVFVPAEAVKAYQQSDSYDQYEDPFSDYQAQIDEAAATGGDVVLPVDFAFGKLPGTAAWVAVKDDMRLRPGGMSAKEAEDFNSRLEDIVTELADQRAQIDQGQANERDARQALVDNLARQIQDAGFTPTAARSYAELRAQIEATWAARLGQAVPETIGTTIKGVLPPSLAEMQQADRVDLVINAMRKGKDASVQGGKSLLEWIAARGGINDTGGDIASMGGDKWHLRPAKGGLDKRGRKKGPTPIAGRSKLIRDYDPRQSTMGGVSGEGDYGLDTTMRAAVAAGYFPHLAGQDVQSLNTEELLAAISDELAGRPTYAEEAKVDDVRLAAEELRQMLGDRGLDPDGMSDAEVRAAVKQLAVTAGAGDTAYDQADEPVSVLTGEEIAPSTVTGKALRTAAAEWFKTNLRGKKVQSSALGAEVEFVGSARKPISSSADERKLRLFAALPDLVKNAPEIDVRPDHKGRREVKAWHYLRGSVDLDGEIVSVTVSIRESTDGHFYYNHVLEDGAALQRAGPAREAGGGSEGSTYEQDSISGDEINISLNEGPRGRIDFGRGYGIDVPQIQLFQSRNPSTLIHEFGHEQLERLRFEAEQANAPENVKADWKAVQDWFRSIGHPVAEGAIPREAHEFFARGFERYLLEGKSPSTAIQRVFEFFRAALLNVYRTVDALRSPITPEIREVFDRLLATEDEIAQAREAQAMQPLFKDPAAIGMTGPEYAAYVAQVDGARDKANADLLAKTMAAIRRRETKRFNDERKGVWADEADRLDNEPILKSLRLMKDTPISLEWLRDRMGQDVTDLLPKRVPPIWREGGANPDALAEMAGFDSGQQMVEVLIGAERSHREQREGGDQRNLRARMIDQAADAEMTRRYGDDPFADGSIEREAIAAVNNELAGELLATEIRALSRRTGQRPTPYKIARQWARERVRQGVVAEEASPGAIQRHQRAVAKAGREAEEAMLKGDMAAALAAKQRQMLSSALLAEAKAAHDDVTAAQERLAKIAKRATMKSVDQDYLDQAHALLDGVQLGPRSQKSIDRQGKWEQWAAAREAEGYDVVVPASFEATIRGTHWSRLSAESLLGLDDAVKQVMHLGRLKQTLLDNQEQREWDEIFDEAVSSAGNIDGPPPADLAEPGWWGALKGKALGADAALLKMETVFDWLDGGDPNGIFNRIAFRPIAEAQAREQDMLKDYYARIKAQFEAVPGATLARWNDVLTPPFVDVHTGRQMRVNRQQVVAMALNIGNEGNLQRLADGYRVSPAAIEQYLVDTLTAEEWSFVQGVWDTIDTLWPQIEGLEKRVNGVAPEKIAPRSFETPNGPMRGGYYPAVYDSSRDYKAEENRGRESDLLSGGYTRATTRASATKDRAEKVNRPILLDLGVINRHLGEVIHDITHREAVIQANRFLTSERVMRAVDEALGPEIRKQFRPWIKFVANSWAMERAGNEAWGKIITKLRANVTAVGMGFRASTMLMQIAGYSNSTEVVGEAAMAKAIAQSTAHPVETFRFVMERSDEVRHRMDTLDRDIRVAIAQMGGAGPTAKAWFRLTGFQKFMFHGIGYMDRVVSVPTWLAAYNKALEAGMSEQDAAYAGDKAVRQSQGAGGAKDLAAVVRGDGQYGKLIQLFTFFYSFFSAQYQRQRTLARDIGGADQRKTRSFHKLFARAFWLMIVPTVLNELLRMGMGSGGPDDDEWWAAWLTKKLLSNSLASLPLVRDVFEPLWDGVTGHAKYGYTLSPMQRIGESAVAVAQDAGKIVQGEDTTRATRNAMEAAGYFTGLVPGQIAAATQFLVDWANGDADPQGFGDWVEGLSTGKIRD